MLAQRHARCQNGLPLGRRSCDGARATSSVSTVATAGPTIAGVEAAGEKSSWSAAVPSFSGRHRRMVVGWKQVTLEEHRGPRKTRQDSSSLGNAARRCPATDFEQVCGAAQAALRISRVVSDVVRAHGVAGGRYGEI